MVGLGSLERSAFYWNTIPWVPTDNIAYFGWGALAGIFLFFIPLFALTTLRVKKGPLRQPDAPFRFRSRPVIVFVAGLAAGVVVWSLFALVALVVTATKVPWPVIWGLGFGTAILGWIPVICAAFLGYFQVRSPGSPARM